MSKKTKQTKKSLQTVQELFEFDEINNGYVTYKNSNLIAFFVVIKGVKFSVLTLKDKQEIRNQFSDYHDLLNRSFFQIALDDEPNLSPQIKNHQQHMDKANAVGKYIMEQTLEYAKGNEAMLRKFLYVYPIHISKMQDDMHEITGALATKKIEYHIPGKTEIEQVFSMMLLKEKVAEEVQWWQGQGE